MAGAPEDPETFRALMSVDRVDEALDCLIRIVDRHPERVAEALRRAEIDVPPQP